jgi:hypothetical protein
MLSTRRFQLGCVLLASSGYFGDTSALTTLNISNDRALGACCCKRQHPDPGEVPGTTKWETSGKVFFEKLKIVIYHC